MSINCPPIPSMTDVSALFTWKNVSATFKTREGAERDAKFTRAAAKAILETQRFVNSTKSLVCVNLVTALSPAINFLGLFALVEVAPSLWSKEAQGWSRPKIANRVLLVAGLAFNNLAWLYEVGLAPFAASFASRFTPLKDGFIFCSSIAGVWSNYRDLQDAKREVKITKAGFKVEYTDCVQKWEDRHNSLATPGVISDMREKYRGKVNRLIGLVNRTAKANAKLERYRTFVNNNPVVDCANLTSLCEAKIAFYRTKESNRQIAIDKAKTGMWSDGGKVAIIGAGNLAMLSGYGAMYKAVGLGIAYLSLAVEYIGEVKAIKEVVYHKKADLPAMPTFATAAA